MATFIAEMVKKQYAFELVILSRAPSAESALTGRKSGRRAVVFADAKQE